MVAKKILAVFTILSVVGGGLFLLETTGALRLSLTKPFGFATNITSVRPGLMTSSRLI